MKKKINQKYTKYLPSKKLSLIVLAGIIIIGGLFLFFYLSQKAKYMAENKQSLQIQDYGPSVNDLIQKDTDGDSIPDWKEALWGTDKNKKATFDDMPDADYIAKKVGDLNNKPDDETGGDDNLTETEKFSRQFMAAFIAMKASGNANSNTINNFAVSLGQNISKPDLVDAYTEEDIKIDPIDDKSEQKKYSLGLGQLYQSYESTGIGEEMDVVSGNIDSLDTADTTKPPTDKEQSAKLLVIADAYQDFAKKMMAMSVPKSLKTYHLTIANSANNTGIGVRSMANVTTDPIVGLSGFSEYQKYSDDFTSAVTDLKSFLSGESSSPLDYSND